MIDDEARLNEVRARYGLSGSFLLADALKNPAALLRAYARLGPSIREHVELVFFSRWDPPAAVASAGRAGTCKVLMRPPLEDLVALYNLASIFVFPSWIEGFGLPVLEAMSCGTPVVASDRGSIPEVAGSAAILVDAEDDAALARELVGLLEEPGKRQKLRMLGLKRAATFTWQRTALETLKVYSCAACAMPALLRTEQPQNVADQGG
ncbi:MAG: glycosyltransferase family 4 protein [Candidatus Marsarchaeota archaeon]|nr:glycosyltransferase family 4 protein [Candidatus Marsarchaeota archaeon]